MNGIRGYFYGNVKIGFTDNSAPYFNHDWKLKSKAQMIELCTQIKTHETKILQQKEQYDEKQPSRERYLKTSITW